MSFGCTLWRLNGARSTEMSDKSRPLIDDSRHATAKMGVLMSANIPRIHRFACLLMILAPLLAQYDLF